MDAERINFYGIEAVPPTGRRARDCERAREGVSQPPRRWLKQSDYHRLLEAERREPWAVFWGILTVLVAGLAVLRWGG